MAKLIKFENYFKKKKKFKTKIINSRSNLINDLNKIEKTLDKGFLVKLDDNEKLWNSPLGKQVEDMYSDRKIFEGFKKSFKFNSKESIFSELFFDFISNSTRRIFSNMRDMNFLLKKKKYLSGMYLLRAFAESSLYDLYVFTELYLLIKKGNIEKFVNLFCKANFSSSSISFKVMYSRLHDKSLNSLLRKFENKKIHINDAIRYYKNTDFKSFMVNYDTVTNNTLEEDKKDSLRIKESCLRLLNNQSYSNPEETINSYAHLCEVIHPNSYYVINENDKESITDFKKLYVHITDYSLISKIFFNITTKTDILTFIGLNKRDFSQCLENLSK